VTTLRRSIRPAAALAAPAIALLLLTGCSGSLGPAPAPTTGSSSPAPSPEATAGADGDQTTTEACDSIVAGLEELGQIDASTLQDDLVNDPEAALATLDEAQAAILDATDSVTNEEIRPYAEQASEATRDYFGTIREAAEDPANADAEAIQAGLPAFTTAIADLQTACTAG
jgi:hypothetical protein